MTVHELIKSLVDMPDDAKVVLTTGLYTKLLECHAVLNYDEAHNDIILLGGKEIP